MVTMFPELWCRVRVAAQGVWVWGGRWFSMSHWDWGWEEPRGDPAVLQTALPRYIHTILNKGSRSLAVILLDLAVVSLVDWSRTESNSGSQRVCCTIHFYVSFHFCDGSVRQCLIRISVRSKRCPVITAGSYQCSVWIFSLTFVWWYEIFLRMRNHDN